MTHALRSLAGGLGNVLRAPVLVAGVLVLTMAAAIPFGIVLGSRLQDALANQPPIDLGSGEIDAEWWTEFRAHADGIAATFTPTVIGFAAPLDNLSALLDGTARPLALAGPVLLTGLIWAWLWGGILQRFNAGRGLSLGEFVSAALSHTPRFVAISVVVALVQILIFVFHAVVFDRVFNAITAGTDSERTAFFIRAGLYIVFGLPVVFASLVADYTRLAVVVTKPPSLRDGFQAGMTFVRRHAGTVASLYVMTALLFVALLIVYGTVEIYAGSRVGGWRGIAVGQAYILARLVIRLTFAASELQLFKSLRDQPS